MAVKRLSSALSGYAGVGWALGAVASPTEGATLEGAGFACRYMNQAPTIRAAATRIAASRFMQSVEDPSSDPRPAPPADRLGHAPRVSADAVDHRRRGRVHEMRAHEVEARLVRHHAPVLDRLTCSVE